MDFNIKDILYIIISSLSIGGIAVKFFQMQTRQNMKIEQLENETKELKEKQSSSTHYQIQTEKEIVEIKTTLSNVVKMLQEIKDELSDHRKRRRDDD